MKHAILASALLFPSIAGCGAAPEAVTIAQADDATNTAGNTAATAQAPATITVARNASAPAAQINPAVEQDEARLTVDGEGLRWFLPPNGSARPIPFGTSQADTLASLERLRGKAAQGTNADCGAGPVQYANWADGLSLVFQRGRFVGWGLDRRAAGAIATADNLGPGTTRRALEDAAGPSAKTRQTSLGTEFSTGALHGIFDGKTPTARVTDMWSGVSCVAR